MIKRIPEPKQTSFGSLLFIKGNRIEFSTEDEAEEYKREIEEVDNSTQTN